MNSAITPEFMGTQSGLRTALVITFMFTGTVRPYHLIIKIFKGPLLFEWITSSAKSVPAGASDEWLVRAVSLHTFES